MCIVVLAASLALTGCAGAPPATERTEVAALATGIRALGKDVDPQEAARAARVAYAHTDRLAEEYRITDPPLVHNAKVNMGLRPRGLCWHWAHDMQARLAQERFRTLELHRAIANADNPFRIDHSTVIVSRRGDTMFDGIVLDPWRKGGVLHWVPTRDDTRYAWRPRKEVLAAKRDRAARRPDAEAVTRQR
nr:hypothetical protein [Roseovarius salinarum]